MQFTKGQKIFLIMAVFVCGLLLYANGVAFNLISAPTYIGDIIAFSALAVAVGLTLVTLTIVIRDQRRILAARKQKINVDNIVKLDQPSDTVSSPIIAQTIEEKVEPEITAIETVKVPDETHSPIVPSPAKVFEKRNLFIIIIAFTVGLLFFANAVAFGLISLPAYAIYGAVAGAVAIASLSVAVILRKKIEVLGTKIKRFISEADLQDILNEEKEPDQVVDIAAEPVIAKTTTKKVDTYEELFRQFGLQNARSRLEADKAEQEQIPKKPVIPPTKVICPACRKEFTLPNYERNYIVDFGPPTPSSLIKRCPHCETSIALKQKGSVEENLWKE
jgi:hypothetical protein